MAREWHAGTGTGDDAPVGGYWWLVVRRHRSTGELAYYRCYTTTPAPLAALVRVAGRRWTSRRTSKPARAAPAWTSIRSAPGPPGIGGPPWSCSAICCWSPPPSSPAPHPGPEGLIRLSLNETRRHLIRAILPSQLSAADADAWSAWRRQHQHRAQQAHYQRQAEREPRADRFGRAEAEAKCVRLATRRLEHSRVMRDSARSTSSDRQSRSRRGHRPRRHAAWTSRSRCRGPADRGSARSVSGRCRARGRRAAGRGQPRSRTR
jgi:hypothetical protein